MCVKVSAQVWKKSSHRGATLLLLLAIADYVNKRTGDAWPSVRTLSRKARLTERHTNRVISKLAKSGELQILPGQGRNKTNLYRVTLASGVGVTSVKPRGMSFEAGRSDIHDRNGVTPVSPKPLEETVKEPSRFHRSNGSDRNLERFDPSEIMDQIRQRSR